MWRLAAKYAALDRGRAVSLALAGDHKNKAVASRLARKDEGDERVVGLVDRSAVKVDARVGLQTTLLHLAEGLVVHPRRRFPDRSGARDRDTVAPSRRFADAKGRNGLRR